MLPTQAFPESLQTISIWLAFESSLARTPKKVAITHSKGQLSYCQLNDLMKTSSKDWSLDPSCESIVKLLQSLYQSTSRTGQHEENTLLNGVLPTLSERELVLSVLNIAVCHPILSRDSVCALPFCFGEFEDQRVNVTSSSPSYPLHRENTDRVDFVQKSNITPMLAIAAMAPLILGGTLCLIQPTNLSYLVELMAQGLVNQAWLDANSCDEILDLQLQTPADTFRGLICVGLPQPDVALALSQWVSPEKLHALALNTRALPWARHLQLSNTLEPYPCFDTQE